MARAKNGAATRETILAAARRCFAAESYDAVGMRDVARAAGFDVALVSRYFGSKEDLFRKVLLERGGEEWFAGGRSVHDCAEWLADLAVGHDGGGDAADIERLSIILRSASSAATAGMIRDAFAEDVVQPLVRLLGGADAEARAEQALSLVIGATVFRGMTHVEPASAAERTERRSRLLRLIEHALTPAGQG